MEEWKYRFQKDFKKASPKDLSFDVSKLDEMPDTKENRRRFQKEPLPRRPVSPRKVAAIAISSILAVNLAGIIALSIPIGMAFFRVKDNVNMYRRSYSLNETALAQANTFRPINQVEYPDLSSPAKKTVIAAERIAYESFADRTYRALLETSSKDNLSYSPVTLYSVTNEMVAACSNVVIEEKLNDLLGLSSINRQSFYNKIMSANSYAKESSSIQLKNGAFFSNKFAYSQDYVSALERLYCEAYELDFDKDAGKIVDWANKAVDSAGFIDKGFLELDSYSVLCLLSTMYFKNAWENKYLSSNNVVEPFYLRGGSVVNVEYMRHTYLADRYWDYGDYVAVKDYYHRGYASVTYLVPKRSDDDILTLTAGANIFKEDETKVRRNEGAGSLFVSLKTPKFALKAETNFRPCFDSLGLGDLFDPEIDSLHGAFEYEGTEDVTFFLQAVKQKNEVEFSEDGTIVKSLALAQLGYGAAAPQFGGNELRVDLDQPFIYIIRDINGTPIFVGHVDNPKG